MKDKHKNTKIILICLIVEKATIFFISISELAKRPPIKKVKNLMERRIKIMPWTSIKLSSFKTRKIPAVTRVEECTIAEIGVGADIAAGSQDESGNWALLVKAQRLSKKRREMFQFSTKIKL